MIFAWDQTNRGHIAKHAVTLAEAQFVVEHAGSPFPQRVGPGKRRVWGPTSRGRMLQVIYILKRQSEITFESVSSLDWQELQKVPDAKVVRIIHAMELTNEMKRQLRRRRR